ncbi:MAG: flagellar motor switch protein FliG [Candidatus Sumerlaeia bacterium]|nr:flagellar motor switch protein FliG [Candidatus Sumerlaeia bacterium]
MAVKIRNTSQLTGPEKAVIVLLSIDDDVSADLLKHLDSSELTKISNYVNLLSDVPRDCVIEVKREFGMTLAERTGGLSSGTRGKMRELMASALPKEKLGNVLEVLDSGNANFGLETLKWLDPHAIANLFRNEHPQTIAFILAHLDPGQAAQVLSLMPENLQADIVMRMAHLERISPEVVRELNEVLAKELTWTGSQQNQSVGGVDAVAEIINQLDKATETKILSSIEELNPGLAENIRELMFVFEDLLRIDDRSMQQIMKEVSNDVLTMALKTASPEIKEKMFKSVSQRAAQMIEEELQMMGPVKLSDVEAAQNEIIKIARRLEEEGKIVIAGKGGGEQLV